MENFGERLRQIRGERSQKEVAAGLGMPQTTLSSLENQDSIPRGEVLEKLAQYFKVPLNYFYEPRQPKPASTDAAKAYLSFLKEPMKGRTTVATQASEIVEKAVRERIAWRIKEHLGEAKNKQ